MVFLKPPLLEDLSATTESALYMHVSAYTSAFVFTSVKVYRIPFTCANSLGHSI